MFLDLIEEPWFFSNHGISISDYSDQSADLKFDGRRDLRLVCPCTDVPWYRSKSNKLPSVSFPFRSHNMNLICYSLPTPCKEKQDGDVKTVLGVSSQTYHIIQEHSIHKFSEDSAAGAIETFVNAWISWSIRLFQELTGDQTDDLSNTFSGVNRRSWTVVAKYVIGEGNQDALMSLIVQLAEKHQLKSALMSISRNPRRILERVRENMKVARIQQMDGGCIREYARRPGYDTATKAGPKQELLAVQRVENTDTLENRVCVWVLNEIESLARKYVRENADFANSQRVGKVRKFGVETSYMKKTPALETVSIDELIHPVLPNYPLQLERRYKEIYETYKKIRHNQKVIDDAWEWQRVLWNCTARLQLYSLFTACPVLQRKYSSFVYIKNESQRGCYLNKSNAPGPFQYVRMDKKKDLCYLIDSWDVTSPEEWLENAEIFPGAHDLGRIGCDAVFYCQTRKKLMLIWYVYGLESSPEHCTQQLYSCQNVIEKFIFDLKRQHKFLSGIEGVIVTSDFQNEMKNVILQTSSTEKSPKVSLLLLSHKKETIKITQEAVVKIIEEFMA